MGTLGLTILWILCTLVIENVHTSGVFELRLVSFTNSLGLNAEGNCCNGIHTTSGLCSSTCRTFFRVCLKHYQNDIKADTCTFGTITTPVLGNNSFDIPDKSLTFTNPVRLPFDFAWPGTFSLIIEAWHDTTLNGPTQGSPRDLISQLATQRSVKVDKSWTHDTYTHNNTVLKYEYRVVCDDNFYGNECTSSCIPRDDDIAGHFTCNEDGSITCREGWTDVDSFCITAVCLAGCHPENGKCKRPNECVCNVGWQGRLCDECIPYPGCQHGSCKQPWQCECEEGWGGLFCNQDLNFCTHHDPCRHGGTCHNTGQGSYTCDCAPGFTGTNCELEVDDCLHLPCHNGGSCVDYGINMYRCQCPEGFHGRHCESSARSCLEQPCQQGALCTDLPAGGYKCTCGPGYTGVNCEIPVDECDPNPCSEHGRCVDEFNGYRCVCAPGWEGARCEQNINDCSLDTCQNGGTCVDGINDFECKCAPGFTGTLCEINLDECKLYNNPCANGGLCHDLVNDFRCDCLAGFKGKDCRDLKDACQSQPCQNGGTCKDRFDGYYCECYNGYFGNNCQFNINDPVVPAVSSTLDPGHATSTEGEPAVGAVKPENDDTLTLQQLLLIICLGIGIPIVLILVVIVVLLCKRRLAAARAMSIQKENEQNEITNMNNQTTKKCIDSDINNQIPPSTTPSVLKITNEEVDSRTYNINQTHNHLNIDKQSNKLYHKDINTAVCGTHSGVKEHSDTRDNKRLSYIQEVEHHRSSPLTVEHLQKQQHERCSPTYLVDSSCHHGSVLSSSQLRPGSVYSVADVHSSHKPINKESNISVASAAAANNSSIFYLEKPHRHRPPCEAMLATEV